MSDSFSSLPLDKALLQNLNDLGFVSMTPIQQKSLLPILDGQDVIAQAQTGSGKTVAFGIGMVHHLNAKQYKIQSVVLTPTRELANQVAQEVRKLFRCIPNIKVLTLTGGVPYKPQVASLYHGAHVIVGTPGRILKHINEENINFEHVHTLVLDEADRMLDMGFSEDIHKIIDTLPKKRQTLLFSATFPEQTNALCKAILDNPINVSTQETEQKPQIEQHFYNCVQSNKTTLLSTLFSHFEAKSVIIFCNQKVQCEDVADDLYDIGFDVLVLHSDLEQQERDETLTLFANKSYPILIASDVAARGLHIEDVDLVINYDVAKNIEVHTHRIGRSARAGKSGVAVTLVDEEQKEAFFDMNDGFDEPFSLETFTLEENSSYELKAPFKTLYINGGKKHKVRAGDILGMLIQTIGLQKEQIGKIDIFPFYSYVAIDATIYDATLKKLESCKIKGKYFKVYPR